MLLQIGFGLTPFESGSLTFAAAAGALLMKFTASAILKRYGFRRVLIVNAVISVAFFASYGLFTPATPHALLLLALLIGGFFRSLEFTALNAVGYADVEQHQMSRATSFASVAQQMSLSIGVALGAAVLEFMRQMHGEAHVAAADFRWAFITVAAVSAASVLSFLRLPEDAGAVLAGRAPREAAAE